MEIHSIVIFARKSATPEFEDSSSLLFRIHSGSASHTPPVITIFFEDEQEATKFKNDVIQSWESFLRKNKEKS